MNSLVKAFAHENNKTVTDNGENAFKSTMDSLVDLFYFIGGSRRNPEPIVGMYEKAAYDDLDLAVRCMLYARDVRGGMGERNSFRLVMNRIANTTPDVARKLIPVIPEVGRFDDLFAFFDTPVEKEAIRYWVTQITSGNALAAKWAPRTRSAKKEYARKIIKVLGCPEQAYRKLVKMHSDTVEQLMSSKQWDQIDYSKLPSLASARLGKAFTRNDAERYQNYLNGLVTGESKVNAGAVYPHDVLNSLREGNIALAEAQWNGLTDYVGSDLNFIPMVDVSGSMCCPVSGSTTAMDVAISLGMYLSQRNKTAFHGHMLTFSQKPKIVDITGLTLHKAYEKVRRMDWGFNTNFQKAYEHILNLALSNKVSQADMPHMMIVLSDMQFDKADGGFRNDSAFVKMAKRFKDAGYEMPRMVFWNLNGNSNVPVTVKEHASLVSGFSPAVMKAVLAGQNYTPIEGILEVLMNSRYDWM